MRGERTEKWKKKKGTDAVRGSKRLGGKKDNKICRKRPTHERCEKKTDTKSGEMRRKKEIAVEEHVKRNPIILGKKGQTTTKEIWKEDKHERSGKCTKKGWATKTHRRGAKRKQNTEEDLVRY